MKTTARMKLANVSCAVAVTLAVGLALARCGMEGPQGPPGGGDITVVNIDVETEVSLPIGRSVILEATVSPGDALIPTLLWELYDDAAGDVVSLGRVPGQRLPLLSGNSVVVTGVSGGEAKIRVAAMGSGDATVHRVVTVRVEAVSGGIAALRAMHGDGNLPATARVYTVIGDERIRPQLLCFDGEEIEITIAACEPGDELRLEAPGAMFTVGAGVTLVLDGTALRGIDDNTGGPLVVVGAGGRLVMNAGAEISGNTNAVYRFPVNNPDLWGGGVRVDEAGALVMNAGSRIRGNDAIMGGGVFNMGDFTMNGGEISGNATETGSVVIPGMGGGVLNAGTFAMQAGAAVLGNTSSGQGGGVQNEGTFTMRGGTISGNAALQGGGVMNAWGTFHMRGGEISDNEADGIGGGVLNASGVFRISDGVIHGLNAPEGYRNTAPAASAALAGIRTEPTDPAPVSQHGTFANDAFELPALGSLPSTGLTITVIAGVLQSPVSATGMTVGGIGVGYHGTSARISLRPSGTAGAGAWTLAADATAGLETIFGFDVSAEAWDVKLEFLEAGDDVLATYLLTARLLETGANHVPLADFTLLPRVSSITIEGIPAGYLDRGASLDLVDISGGGRHIIQIEVPVGAAPDITVAVNPPIHAEGRLELELQMWSAQTPPWVRESVYRTAIDPVPGNNVIPFSEWERFFY